ncbi:DNA polymerase delta subunit 2 [Lucilia sericata]|uniref:DNA polymerase delta subunit 2 n=1 Tax=Lucilia sericata TaxID=13632 RepID=UPI0018A86010|nr:DNA polymerase delta subunit 2 [Lucilia sericata]
MSTQQYENHSQKFLIKSFDYQKQFSHLYAHRLAEMSTLMQKRAIEEWGSKVPIKKLCDLREDTEEECIIIGTIYKHQAHKPSILKEISEENQLAPQPPRENYSDPEDKVILEDELQRVRLHGKVRSEEMATGIVCAAMGLIEEDGRFDVQGIIFYESGPQRPLKEKGGEQRLLILVSGLDWVQSHNYVDSLNLLQHWLRGNLLSGQKAKNVRMIIAGNSVRSCEEKRVPTLQTKSNDSHDTIDAMKALDDWFNAWSSSLAIDVMPGPYDPANFMLPQQPFHSCMFPTASQHENFQSVSNPYACTVDDALIVGTAGQNVKDLIRCTAIEKPLDALRFTLQWGHIAPTAPDTLACYPYIDSDPFIMKECPHIYFAGNCNEFSSLLHEGSKGQKTRLVCVPSFATTQSVAVVNLETLECHEISFNCAQAD